MDVDSKVDLHATQAIPVNRGLAVEGVAPRRTLQFTDMRRGDPDIKARVLCLLALR